MRRMLFSAMLLVLAVSTARADVYYQYVGVPQGSTTVAPGGTVTVNLYLQETVTTGTTQGQYAQTASIIGQDGGLTGAAVFINTVSGSTATITGISNNVGSGGFTNNNKTATASGGTQGIINEAYLSPDGNNPGSTISQSAVTQTTTNKIYLGSITVTAGSTAGNTTFALESSNNAPTALRPSQPATITSGTNVLFNDGGSGIDLDSNNNNSISGPPPAYQGAGTNGFISTAANGYQAAFQFTITTQAAATPEPSSMLLCGLAVSGMGFGAWRRRKAKLQAEAAPVVDAPLAV